MSKVLGIDVSKWQDDNSTPQMMDFSKSVAKGAKFVFIKASERLFADADFIWNWKNAKTAGLLRGAYHFLRWDISGQMQANFFCDLLEDDPGELPPVADFEAPAYSYGGVMKYPSNALLWQFIETVQMRMGVKPIIYTSPGFWGTHGRIKGTGSYDSKWANYPLWVANYGVSEPSIPKPWDDYTFWQYSANGDGLAFGAESKSLDMNWFNGDYAALLEFAGIEEPTEPDEPEEPTPTPSPELPSTELVNRVSAIEDWIKGFK
jgi:lysozyme